MVGCIDHHKEEHAIPKLGNPEEPRIVETAGSCTSLVVNEFRSTWQSLTTAASQSSVAQAQGDQAVGADDVAVRRTWDAQIAKLGIASILVDTQALRDENKTTEHDKYAVGFLEAVIQLAPRVGVTFDRESFFQAISAAKRDVDSLDIDGLLRKDYKQWKEGSMVLGISTIIKPLSYLIKKTDGDKFKQVLQDFAGKRKLSLLALMTASTSEAGDFQRELLLLAVQSEAEVIFRTLEHDAADELQLSAWNEEKLGGSDDSFKVWWQRDLSKSRKQVAPLIRDIMARKQ